MSDQLDRIEQRLGRLDDHLVGTPSTPGVLIRLDRIEEHVKGQKDRQRTLFRATSAAVLSFVGSLVLFFLKAKGGQH